VKRIVVGMDVVFIVLLGEACAAQHTHLGRGGRRVEASMGLERGKRCEEERMNDGTISRLVLYYEAR
jgi:hypothetical protein